MTGDFVSPVTTTTTTTFSSLDLPPIATLEDDGSVVEEEPSVDPASPRLVAAADRIPVPIPEPNVWYLEQVMQTGRFPKGNYTQLLDTVERLCTTMSGQSEDRIVGGVADLHHWVEEYENAWPVRILIRDVLKRRAPRSPPNPIASSSKPRTVTVHLSKKAKTYLIDYFDNVNTNPHKPERARLLEEVRRIDGLDEEYNDSKLNTWFVARRRQMRNAPDAISEVDAAACYNKLDDQGQGFLKALVARSSKKTPSTSTIAEWADLVKRDVDTVKGALVHLRNQEKLEHHRKSHTPDAKELKPNIDWVMSQVPPAAPKEPRPVPAETHLPTPAVSVSPEPAPRVPSTLSSTAPAISPLTRPVPPPINTTFTVHPQSQPPSSASTSAPPTGTPLAGTSSGYSLPRLSFDYPTRLPPTGLHPTVSHYRPQTFLPNQTPTPYQLPSPVESRTTFLATAPPTAATPVPPTVKEQVSPPSQAVEYLHLGPAPMDIDPTPRPPPPRSIDAFLTQTDAYDALLEGIFDKTSRGELARWGLYSNMLPPSAEP